MFPRLTPVQWALFIILLFFYGFAVFALTRDYYVRHPPRLAATAPVADPAAIGERMRAGLNADAPAIPPEVLANDPELLGQEADRLFVAQRYRDAIPLYRQLLALTPEDADAMNDLGLALHYSGDAAGALAMLRAGTAAAPTEQRVWLSLGFVAAQSGDGTQARTALTQARDLAPDSEVGREATRLLGLLPAP